MDEGWVCVALETVWMLLVVSGTGLRVLSVNAASSLGRFSAAVSAGNHKENFLNAADGAKSISFVIEVRVTSNGERAIVSSVYDEAVHVHGDGQGLRISGTVLGTGILKQNTLRFLHQCH